MAWFQFSLHHYFLKFKVTWRVDTLKSFSAVVALHLVSEIWGLFTLILFSTLPNFGKVAKKITTFSLLSKFGNYIRNPAKILAILVMPKFDKVFFGTKVNRPLDWDAVQKLPQKCKSSSL